MPGAGGGHRSRAARTPLTRRSLLARALLAGASAPTLSALLACLNLLAFAIHTVCDLAEGAWRKARTTLGPRVRFFQSLQVLTSYLVFSSWTELLHTLAFAKPPPSPSG